MNARWVIAVFVLFSLSGCGEKATAPQITVTGEAVIEKKAEIFRMAAHIGERSKDQLASLEAAAQKLKVLKSQLARLNGLTHLKITSTEAVSEAIRPRGCDRTGSYGETEYPETCDPVDFITSIDVVIKGEPAVAAGKTTSMLTELGLEKVQLLGYGVHDPQAVNLEVRQMALRDAMHTAQALASQAGMRLGKPIDISYGGTRGPTVRELLYELRSTQRAEAEFERTAPVSPRIELELSPLAVRFAANVTAKFALEKSKPEK